jgi:hypothetical protein
MTFAGLHLIAAIMLAAPAINGAAAQSRTEIPAKIMGFINVRDFGAVGDGKTDDTAAIQAAIAGLPKFTRRNPFGIKPIYFPNGIYLVSGTLKRVEADGHYAPGLAFIGESEAGVTLRLKDAARGFDDPNHPRPLLYFASGLLGNVPNAGGKDYLGLGEGNDAYQNYIETMTIDTGHDNPGAVGADYLASNIGAIRGVRFIAPDGKGKTGISLTRKWIGPALIKDVAIEGFGVGIDVANTEYSIVLDGIRVSRSSEYGIRNNSNSVSLSNARISTASGVGIANLTPQALLVGRDLRIEGKNEKTVLNQGYMNLVEAGGTLATSGKGSHQATAEDEGKLNGVFGPSGKIGDPAWQLPVKSAPSSPQYPTKDWADVSKFGAVADTRHDSTAAIQAAMNSGRPVICFPNGVYRTTAPIVIPYTVHRIEGSFSTAYLDFRKPESNSEPSGQALHQTGFVVGARETPLFLRRLTIRNDINVTTNTAKTAFVDSGQGAFSLADIVIGEMVAINRLQSGGEIFAENIIGGKFSFAGRNGIWIRQLNTEGKGVRIQNEGARLWVLGTKTENNMTLLENKNGAVSELFGGLAYMVHADGRKVPYLHNVDGRITAAFAEESFFPDAIYETFLKSEEAGQVLQVKGVDMPLRHHSARMVPQISTEAEATAR